MLAIHAATPTRVASPFSSFPRTLLTIALAIPFAAALPAQWLQANPPASPPARTDAAVAYDPTANATLVFGGDDLLGNPLGDTWAFDGSAWTAQPSSVPARTGARMVFDTGRAAMVLYGGASTAPFGGPATDETWERVGGNWVARTPTVTPGGRAWYGMAYDPARARTVLYGGRSSDFVSASSADTWEYDGANWQLRATAQNPGPRSRHAMCHHIALGVTVLFGGEAMPFSGVDDQTWHFDGTNWHLVPVTGARPPARVEANLVYDAVRGVCVLHGGHEVTTGTIFRDTWEWNGVAWTNVTPTTPQPTLYRAAMAMDLARSRLVAFGGFDALFQPLAETWQYGADYRTFGTGCAGTNGVPSLAAQGAPRLGSIFSVLVNQASNVPVAAMVLGLSTSVAGTTPLPFDLSSLGFTGCTAYVSPDVLTTMPVVAGTGLWAAPLPLAPGLIGFRLHQQAIVLDPGVNPAGAVTSDAATLIVGS